MNKNMYVVDDQNTVAVEKKTAKNRRKDFQNSIRKYTVFGHLHRIVSLKIEKKDINLKCGIKVIYR